MAGTNLATLTCGTLANPTVETAFPSPSNPSSRAVLSVGSVLPYSGGLIKIRAVFRVTFGSTFVSFRPAIRVQGSANTNLVTFNSGLDIVMAGPVASAANSATTKQWIVTMDLTWHSSIQLLRGMYKHLFDTTMTAWAISGITSGVRAENLKFCCTGIFGGSDAGNSVALTEFAIDQD